MERFWAKVRVLGPDDCWEWLAARSSGGYGQFRFFGNQRRAHRVAWALTNGKIPDGLLVLHKCDNKLCCNPSHLFVGTQADNMADKVAKGRQFRSQGELDGQSKLSAVQVAAVREELAAGGVSQRKIAKRLGVASSTISRIACGLRWRSV